MKLDIFKEKKIDLIQINNRDISFFRILKTTTKIKVLTSEKIESEIYSRGLIYMSNLESALEKIFQKHIISEPGIIINTPNLLFQKINLVKGKSIKEAILNHLKSSSPLPIEKYSLFYKEDKYRAMGTVSTFNIFLISKEIIDRISYVTQKYASSSIFISPSCEIVYQYLLSKSFLDFNEEYLVFFLEGTTLVVLLIKNLRLEKIILEEYIEDKVDINLVILRIYNFLKSEIKSSTKILFLKEKEKSIQIPEIENQLVQPTISPTSVILEGGYFVFNDVLSDKQVIDFSPLKNYTIYFLNRLPGITTFAITYTLLLLSIISAGYFFSLNKLNKKITELSSNIKANPQLNQDDLLNFKNNLSKINVKAYENFLSLNKILELENLENVAFEANQILFSLNTEEEKINDLKSKIKEILPKAHLESETKSNNMVKLNYSIKQ
jgi:hypothetical protein